MENDEIRSLREKNAIYEGVLKFYAIALNSGKKQGKSERMVLVRMLTEDKGERARQALQMSERAMQDHDKWSRAISYSDYEKLLRECRHYLDSIIKMCESIRVLQALVTTPMCGNEKKFNDTFMQIFKAAYTLNTETLQKMKNWDRKED